MTDTKSDSLDKYDELVRKSYRLAGHHTGFGYGKPASIREQSKHRQKVIAAREELRASLDQSANDELLWTQRQMQAMEDGLRVRDNRIKALEAALAEAEQNINLKADFIENTVNDMAALEDATVILEEIIEWLENNEDNIYLIPLESRERLLKELSK